MKRVEKTRKRSAKLLPPQLPWRDSQPRELSSCPYPQKRETQFPREMGVWGFLIQYCLKCLRAVRGGWGGSGALAVCGRLGVIEQVVRVAKGMKMSLWRRIALRLLVMTMMTLEGMSFLASEGWSWISPTGLLFSKLRMQYIIKIRWCSRNFRSHFYLNKICDCLGD